MKIIACFLNNRKFRVNHNGGESSTRHIQAGVPQGSVLAPILYNIYTSDIPTSAQVNLALYADDTAIYTSNRNLRYARLTLQRYLNTLTKWFKDWNINTNQAKTKAIIFTRRRPTNPPRLQMHGRILPYVRAVKYLGVTLDTKLLFNEHIDDLASRGNRAIKMLMPLLRQETLSTKNKRTLYTSLVRSRLTYAAPAWTTASKFRITKLQRIQNKTLRMILRQRKRTPIHQLHNLARLDTIPELIARQTSKLALQITHHNNRLIRLIGNEEPAHRKHVRLADKLRMAIING